MRPIFMQILRAGLVVWLTVGSVSAQQNEAWRAMNQPVEPFQISGNLYYVGASSVTAFLLTTPEGHILIDGGFPETAPMIRSGIEELGFEIGDVRVLLNSHAHFDHAGGLAQLQEWSGAEIRASERDAPLLERGGLGDDLFGDQIPYPAPHVDRRLQDGDTVTLGGTTLTAHVTAGHTRGCTSWSFEVEEAGEAHTAVSTCSLSVLDGMRFLEEETHPGIAEDYRSSFETLEAIEAEIFLSSHAEVFRLAEKRARQLAGDRTAFIDPVGYRDHIEQARADFDEAIAAEREELKATSSGSAPGSLPATFLGTLPCADCPGVEVQLNLSQDNVFFLRSTYMDREDGPFDDIGTWSLGSDGTTLVLSGGRESPTFYSFADGSTLRKLDLEGREIESDLNYDLRRQERFSYFEPQLHMHGMFRYMADAALFEECLTGRKLPVAQEADYLALERAYLNAKAGPGEPLLTHVEGTLALRPPMEGDGQRPTLVVSRFVGVHPGEACAPRPIAAELIGPRWELRRLGDEAIVNPEGREAVHLEFDGELSRVYGFTGCNRLHGGFKLDGDKLSFGPTAMTMMACLDEMETEQKLAVAMKDTASWKILGTTLELYDAAGDRLARLKAKPPTD